jgi:hypothetical protein
MNLGAWEDLEPVHPSNRTKANLPHLDAVFEQVMYRFRKLSNISMRRICRLSYDKRHMSPQ